MKKLLFLPLVLVLAVGAHAQSDKFVGAMKKNIDLLDSAFRDLATMQSLANNFERIANAEKTNGWLITMPPTVRSIQVILIRTRVKQTVMPIKRLP